MPVERSWVVKQRVGLKFVITLFFLMKNWVFSKTSLFILLLLLKHSLSIELLLTKQLDKTGL